MAKESAADRKTRLQEDARKKKTVADEKAREKAKAAAEDKYQKQYMAFLDDVAKGDKRNFEQWKKHQYYKDRKAKEKKKQLALGKKEVALAKETRNLVRDQQKTLKSNTGKLLEGLGITSKTAAVSAGMEEAALKVKEAKSASAKETAMVEQKGWNLAAEARKQALIDIEMGVDFDAESYSQDLNASLREAGVEGEALKDILEDASDWGGNVANVIGEGGGEDFAKKLTLSKDSLSGLDMFEEKMFNIKGFIQDPNFRGMLMKGFFIGLAVKAAAALGEALKAGFDFAREMGVSLSSMPLAVGLAREEATALLEEFGSLKDMTSANLLNMKWNAYWYGVSGADSAKLLKLQMSITDSTKEMALEDQRDFMKELKDEGLSASKVMADMAGHSEFIAKYMKDGGDNMEAAAKYAASLGMDLGVAESMADKLLDYESSIAAEMEASMILGRSINLDKARQLAYTGDIEEMMREVKLQAGGEAEFAKMTAVQRESLGDALGLNASQMAEFVKEQDVASESAAKFHWGWVAIMGGIGTAIGLLIAAKNQLMALNPVVGAAKTKVDMGLIAKGGGRGLAMGIGAGAAAATGAYAMGRASGGPVKAGNPYVVGEKRAELFVPGVSGNILPSVPGMQDGSLQWPDMGKLSDTLGGKLDQIAAFLNQGNDDRNFGNRKLGGQIERSGGQF